MYDQSSPVVINQLIAIAELNPEGKLLPEDVIESARPKTSILHKFFTWDDTKAANERRIDQARGLIRATVRWIQVNGDKRPVRVFISLTEDRNDSGGYRPVVVCLNDKRLRRQMLEDALRELQVFERKYANLKELSDLFAKSKEIRKRLQQAWTQSR